MRPDEHKKKKSAAYKKKHHQAQTNETSGERSSGKNDQSWGTKKSWNNNASTTGGEKKSAVNQQQQQHRDAEQSEYAQKFKKRTLETNWSRYEEKQDSYEAGDSYESLLAAATDASSCLILDSEKDWDNYKDFDPIFRIDCGLIHHATSQMSFGEKFNLTDLIEPDLAKVLAKDAVSEKRRVDTVADVALNLDVMALDRRKIEFTRPTVVTASPDPAITPKDNDEVEDLLNELDGSDTTTAICGNDVDHEVATSFPIQTFASTVVAATDQCGDNQAEQIDELEDWLDSVI